MEAEQFQDRQSLVLRTRKADDRNSREREDMPASKNMSRKQILSGSAFCSVQAFSGFHEACPYLGGGLLYSVYRFRC